MKAMKRSFGPDDDDGYGTDPGDLAAPTILDDMARLEAERDEDDPPNRYVHRPRAVPPAAPSRHPALTATQRRVRGDWDGVRRFPDTAHVQNGDGGLELFVDDDASPADALRRVQGVGSFREDAIDAAAVAVGSSWLREHDPRLQAEGVEREIRAALDAAGVTLGDVRARCFGSGRPSAERIELRAVARRALAPIYEQGRRRVLMAQVLGCSRKTLHAFMGKP